MNKWSVNSRIYASIEGMIFSGNGRECAERLKPLLMASLPCPLCLLSYFSWILFWNHQELVVLGVDQRGCEGIKRLQLRQNCRKIRTFWTGRGIFAGKIWNQKENIFSAEYKKKKMKNTAMTWWNVTENKLHELWSKYCCYSSYTHTHPASCKERLRMFQVCTTFQFTWFSSSCMALHQRKKKS